MPITNYQVQFKEFALDFDNLVVPPEEAPTGLDLMSEAQRAGMTRLRVAARNKKLDLTDAFSEYAGTGTEATLTPTLPQPQPQPQPHPWPQPQPKP